jgi:hypothetical protein
MPRVNIPGVGFVNFPDTMTPDEISAVIRKNYKPQQAAPTPQPQAAAPQPNIAQQAQQNLARIKAGQDIPADSVRPARAASAGELGAAGGIGVGVGALEGVPSLAAMGADATFDTLTAGPVRRAVKSVVPGAPVLLPWENADDPSMPLTQAVASLGDRAQRGLKSAVGLDGIATDATDALSRDILSAPIEPWAAVKGLRKVLQKGAAGTVKEAATNVAPKLADEAIDATDAAVQAARAQSPAPVTETITADVEVPPAPAPYSFRYSTDPNDLNQRTFYHGSGTANLRPEALDPTATKIEGLYSQGIYLTDNPDIAKGYATARRNAKSPTLYEAGVNVGKVLDLEAPITPDVAQIMEARARQLLDDEPEYLAPVLQKLRGGTSGDVMEELGKQVELYSKGNMIPISEFYDGFGLLSEELKHAGYDALTHVGGKKTGRNPHQVLILLDPNDRYAQTGRSGQVTRFEPSSLNGSHGAPPSRRPLKDVWAEFQQAEREANEAFGNISKVDAALADAMTPTEAKRAPIAMTIDPATGRGVPKKYNIIPQAEQRRMMAEARAAADAAMARRNALQKELDEVAQAEDAAQKAGGAAPPQQPPPPDNVVPMPEPKPEPEGIAVGSDVVPQKAADVVPIRREPDLGPEPKPTRTGFLRQNLEPITRRLENSGPVGQKVNRVLTFIDKYHKQHAGRAIQDVTELSKLSKDELQNFIDVQTKGTTPMNDTVARQVGRFQQHFDDVAKRTEEARVGTLDEEGYRLFHEMKDYFPTVFEKEKERAIRLGEGAYGTFTGALQRARKGEGKLPTADEVVDVLKQYFSRANRTIAEAKFMRGGDDLFTPETVKGRIEEWANEAERAGEDGQYIAQTMSNVFHGRKQVSDAEQAVIDGIGSFEVAAKLPLAVFSNATQTAATFGRAGIKPTFEALWDLRNSAKRADMLEAYTKSGAALDYMTRELMNPSGSKISKVAQFVLRRTGFSFVEKWNRVIAVNAGMNYAKDLAKILRGEKTFTTQAGKEFARRDLSKILGVEIGAIDDIAKRGLTEDEMADAGLWMSEKTQFSTNRESLPATWIRSPWANVVTNLKSFALKQAWFITDELVRPAVLEGRTGPLLRYLVTGAVSATAFGAVKDYFTGKSYEDRDAADIVVDRIAMILMMDQVSRMFSDARRGDGLRSITPTIVGDVSHALHGAYQVGKDAYDVATDEKDVSDVAEEFMNGEGVARDIQAIFPPTRAIFNRTKDR